jgi:hypothetical protein
MALAGLILAATRRLQRTASGAWWRWHPGAGQFHREHRPAPGQRGRGNNNLLKDLKDLLDRLTNELIPNLDQIQRNQGDALAQANAAQRQAMEVERIRAQITAEVLATSQGRLAAELSDGITAGITGPIRGVFSQLFRGEMNFAQMSEELSIQMAERVTGAFLNAALARSKNSSRAVCSRPSAASTSRPR